MSVIYRVRTRATGLQGGSWVSQLYFDGAGAGEIDARNAVVAFWQAMQTQISSNVTMTVEGDVYSIEATTDEIVGVASFEDTVVVGTNGGSPNPAATQGLVRLLTGAYVGGRQIRGKIFVWGTVQGQVDSGGTTSAYRNTLNTAVAALISNPDTALGVYSRKNGILSIVSAGNAWTEFAVLRSRRD